MDGCAVRMLLSTGTTAAAAAAATTTAAGTTGTAKAESESDGVAEYHEDDEAPPSALTMLHMGRGLWDPADCKVEFQDEQHRADAYRLATRALLFGTVLAVTSFGAGVAATMYYLEVRTLQEFSDKMKNMVPNWASRLQQGIHPTMSSVQKHGHQLAQRASTELKKWADKLPFTKRQDPE